MEIGVLFTVLLAAAEVLNWSNGAPGHVILRKGEKSLPSELTGSSIVLSYHETIEPLDNDFRRGFQCLRRVPEKRILRLRRACLK